MATASRRCTDGVRAFAPGRVNVIGEHTDYNDGLCLPFAIEQGVTAEVRDGDDGALRVRAVDLAEQDAFEIATPGRAGGWRAFVRGTVAELQREGHRLRGGDLTIRGELPRG